MNDLTVLEGLSGLVEVAPDLYFALVPTHLIDKNDWNPNSMDLTKFKILKDKIAAGHMRQTVLLIPNGGRFTIVDGEHRWSSAVEANHETVPALISLSMTATDAKVETIAMNNLRGEYIPLKMAELLVDLKQEMTDDEIRARTGMDRDEVASLSALLEVGDFSFDDVPVIATDHKETPIPVHIVLFPQQYKKYQEALELAVELGGGMVTPLMADQVVEYDKAMKTAFSIAGVQLRNQGLATVCSVFNAMPKDQIKELLAKVIEANPNLLSK